MAPSEILVAHTVQIHASLSSGDLLKTVVAMVVESLARAEIASSHETIVLLLRHWLSGVDGWAVGEGRDRFVAQTVVLLAMTGTTVSSIQSGAGLNVQAA